MGVDYLEVSTEAVAGDVGQPGDGEVVKTLQGQPGIASAPRPAASHRLLQSWSGTGHSRPWSGPGQAERDCLAWPWLQSGDRSQISNIEMQ